ncbi:MAG: hypothetical protein KGV57_01175 [Fusobacterium sp.]|nr:hypothetical protein [Fusobacterium sp.]
MGNKLLIDTEGLKAAIQEVLVEERKNDNGLAGGYNGSFPLSTATKGHIYLLPENRKLYVCTSNYNGSRISVPNSHFEELSIFQNRDRLENLHAFIKVHHFSNRGIDLRIEEYNSFYIVSLQSDAEIPPNILIDINFGNELTIKVPHVGRFTLPPISGNEGTTSQFAFIYSNRMSLRSGAGLSATVFGGGIIPKL